MRRLLIALTTALTATIAVACGASSSESGETAPDFSLPVANRNVDITLSDFHGDQNVVLVFYRGFF
ncbi:MAG: redoxin domain-containing protein [Chloroflexi bacterium]|nr:redoxin domain-containing protein [Chloroflexota bacterium]